MANNCNICNKVYSSYQSLWIHNKKFHNNKSTESMHNSTKSIHKVDIITNKKYKCIHCNKEYTNKTSKYRHQKDCKITKELCEIKIEKLQNKIEQLEKKVNKKVINNTNNGTIINNNNIIINKIGSENLLEFNDNEISQIFNKELESIITFIELLNFNERLSLFLGKYNFPKNKDWVVG